MKPATMRNNQEQKKLQNKTSKNTAIVHIRHGKK